MAGSGNTEAIKCSFEKMNDAPLKNFAKFILNHLNRSLVLNH